MQKLAALLLPLLAGAFSATAAPRPLPAAPTCAPWEYALLKATPTIHLALASRPTNCPSWGGMFYSPTSGNGAFVPVCAPGGNNSTNGSSWAVFSFYPGHYDGYTYKPEFIGNPYYTWEELPDNPGVWRVDVTDPAGMGDVLTIMITQTDPQGHVSAPQEFTMTFN